MKNQLNYIIQNQLEFTIDSQNFSNEILVDQIINGSNFYVIELSVCQFQNCDILYADFLQCRFKDCTFHKGLWRKSNFNNCVFQNCTFVGIEFSRVQFLSTNFIDCTLDNLFLRSSTFLDCDVENTNFLNLKFDLKNPTLISNSKTSIGVTNFESFQEIQKRYSDIQKDLPSTSAISNDFEVLRSTMIFLTVVTTIAYCFLKPEVYSFFINIFSG